jgi:HK97 family phage major capsid protein
MTSDSALVPKITGTVTVAYLPEGGNLTDSSQTWTNIRLTVQKAGCLIVASNEIAEDAVINFADNLAQESAWALSQTEDLAAFTGDGTSTYGGQVGVTTQLKLLDSTIGNIAGLTVGTGNTYAELTLADFQNAAAKLPAYADNPRTRWFMNRSFYVGTAQRLATAAGVTPFPDPATGLQTFLAYPVQFTQVLPKAEADSQVCALLGDLSLSTDFGDRRFTGIRLDPFSLAHKDQIQVSVTSRFHIVTHSIGNASSVAADRVPGPIVGLITAAS